MRSIKTVALVAATLLLVPQLAVAADLDTEVQDMKQRLEQMETQLKAQDKELAAAQEDRSATSALSSFLESTDISGFVAGGWSWNKEDGGSDSNTFAIQQYWIEMNKAPTEESRAGFDIALQGGEFCTVGGCNALDAAGIPTGGNTAAVHLYTANVSYLAPIGSGLTVTAGIMPTLIGYEVENQNGNFFITRSLVWDQQPVTSTGVTVNYGITDALSLTVGAINAPIGDTRFSDATPKSVTSLLSYSAEKFYLSAGLNWGHKSGSFGTGGDNSKGIFDLIATVNPTDALMIGANYDYHFGDDAAGAKDPAATGNAVSVFATYQVVEKTGVGARFDYVDFDADNKQWAITATVAQSITDGLTGKVEYRYDKNETDPTTDVDTNTVYVQMMYEF
ncbi:MAG: outer membrane beta-barrel protein [Myxococcota bacterium]